MFKTDPVVSYVKVMSNVDFSFTYFYSVFFFFFQKETEKKDLIVGIHDGSLSIVVGTHALLGNQIKYNNLGLLVIDEEQV